MPTVATDYRAAMPIAFDLDSHGTSSFWPASTRPPLGLLTSCQCQFSHIRRRDSLNLKELREKSGLTQENVGRLLDVDQAAVSHWENGKNAPSRKYRKMLAKLYGVSVEELPVKSPADTA